MKKIIFGIFLTVLLCFSVNVANAACNCSNDCNCNISCECCKKEKCTCADECQCCAKLNCKCKNDCSCNCKKTGKFAKKFKFFKRHKKTPACSCQKDVE